MDEARELIAFYDEHGWDWRSALCFVLCRQLFGKNFRIYNEDVISYGRVRRK